MKNMKVYAILLGVLFSMYVSAQNQDEITGIWDGKLIFGKQTLRLVFHISKTGKNSFSATMDSPDQGQSGIPMDKTTYKKGLLLISSDKLGINYEAGVNADGKLEGSFKQNGFKFPLLMEKVEEVEALERPQEPKAPFPYEVKEVKFENKEAGINLAGTLTYPKEGSKFPALILISGSGPQNRDEELMGHKPFWVIADYLSRNGYAVLRYDDRGVAESEGDFETATTYDLSTDAEAAFHYLKGLDFIDETRVGMCGHSEGGMIAPMVASRNADVAFLVLLAAPSIDIDSLMLLQSGLILKSAKIPDQMIQLVVKNNREIYNVLKAEDDHKRALKEINKIYKKASKGLTDTQKRMLGYTEEAIKSGKQMVMTPWFRYFIRFKPSVYLEKLMCPVLALNGSKDLQVPAWENLAFFEKISQEHGGQYTVKEFKGLNHLFQPADTGSPAEYGRIEESFSEEVLEYMLQWLNQL